MPMADQVSTIYRCQRYSSRSRSLQRCSSRSIALRVSRRTSSSASPKSVSALPKQPAALRAALHRYNTGTERSGIARGYVCRWSIQRKRWCRNQSRCHVAPASTTGRYPNIGTHFRIGLARSNSRAVGSDVHRRMTCDNSRPSTWSAVTVAGPAYIPP